MISKWQEFLQTHYAKENVPDWFDKLQSVIQSQQDPEDQAIDTQHGNTREEWMILSDPSFTFNIFYWTKFRFCL